ncbi:hypothetical protein BTN49_2552 [Candidatus Enterovibrio escicola]|uniref:Uncharacterized protein n=1 Tax=Candidatus Enterovibrio escicola TaxID=1927127 RepID=A0A2A5T145_9GAMM|nr:hypothetical protein BTN49_2552 [Candidatus Enterovibrio escacola]
MLIYRELKKYRNKGAYCLEISQDLLTNKRKLTSDLHKRLLIKPSHLDIRLLWLK